MSQRSSSGDAVRRAQAAQIKKPFPWGTVAVGVVLVLFLGFILGYAVLNTGKDAPTPLRDADRSFDGLLVQDGLGRNHVNGAQRYPHDPPIGGNHAGTWQNCGVYADPVPKEQAVHSLEHGAVWITYQPGLPADDVKHLAGLVERQPYGLVSPYPGLKTKVSVQAWGRQLTFDDPRDGTIEDFVDKYADGPQTPEKGASCQGGSSQTGQLPPAQVAPPVAPSGAATGAPSGAPQATPSG